MRYVILYCMPEKLVLKNLATLPELVSVFLDELALLQNPGTATVLGLSGDLGAGKTTFVQALAAKLGVREVVQSPTFTILKLYQTNHPEFKQLIHMDAYRIESLDELGPLRLGELLNTPETLFAIEWPEKIMEALPGHILLKFKTISEDEREVVITKADKNQA